MQRLPEQDIYVYKTPGEEVHKILVGDMDGKRLKAFSKLETATGKISYKIFSEDANQNMENLVEGEGTPEDFKREVQRMGELYLEPIGESWREVEPKYMKEFNPLNPCPKH
ncbi:hypothetical protein Dred_2901 [Desulforamulus reducens MI-1]|uniref:Uncharacterized protein n=1 Tax=Desulforamulus reducens (strain ATCC BAA-1160 / DSM 100696 / MI-1) TaxID=349161 RepID=A4J8K2_DESRM|nr:hypothetical protein [Desulforamulus reducens]ABO51405.1 hypothetical protein Dred_2901 [Desulforamulus reducens MI-1]